jgi:LmbE family N-acetylglucosaminyl deacetylase
MVATHDPWKRYDLNDDHRAVGLAAAHAALLAANNLYFPDQASEGLGAHFTPLVSFFNTDYPNLWVDISDYFSRKEAAIKLHQSQFGNRTSFFLDLQRKTVEEGKKINKAYAEAHHLVLNS